MIIGSDIKIRPANIDFNEDSLFFRLGRRVNINMSLWELKGVVALLLNAMQVIDSAGIVERMILFEMFKLAERLRQRCSPLKQNYKVSFNISECCAVRIAYRLCNNDDKFFLTEIFSEIERKTI